MINVMDATKDFFQSLFEKHGTSFSKQVKETLFAQGDRVQFVFALKQGEIRLVRHLEHGLPLSIHRVTQGLVGEGALFSETYHCSAIALSDVSGWWMKKGSLLALINADPTGLQILGARLTQQLHRSRQLLEIRSLVGIDHQIDAYIGCFGILPNGKALADELGVSPETIYRSQSWKGVQLASK